MESENKNSIENEQESNGNDEKEEETVENESIENVKEDTVTSSIEEIEDTLQEGLFIFCLSPIMKIFQGFDFKLTADIPIMFFNVICALMTFYPLTSLIYGKKSSLFSLICINL